jgi:Protein of unknown function (DUF2971)
MDLQWKYLTQNDETAMRGVIEYWMPHFVPAAPAALYHYTRGETLIQIIESGKLWSTQIGCLNDTVEVRYGLEGLRRRIRERRETAPAGPEIETLLRRLDQVLSDPQLETAPAFVTCFSILGDDLAQWRAYSGGEGGYAIRFDPQKLAKSGMSNEILLHRIEYDLGKQATLLDDILTRAERYYVECEGRARAPNLEEWAQEFLDLYLSYIETFLLCLKDPAFEAEREWRLVYTYRPDDPTCMCFRQRQSMMSRHLPLRLEGKLPITGVMVGPCRYPLLSRIAVSDLLQANGYDPAVIKEVAVTKIPYRAV